MSKVLTKEYKEIDCNNIASYELIATKDAEGVHWGWYMFWLVVWFPALVIVAIVDINKRGGKEFQVLLESKTGQKDVAYFDEDNFNLLVSSV